MVRRIVRAWAAGIVLLLLAGCPATQRPAPAGPAAVSAPGAPAVPAGAEVFRIDAAESEVAIEVRRSGALARLGHNHVVTADGIDGSIWLHRNLARCGFHIVVPVARLVVDDDAARRAAGDGFPLDLSAADKAATRRNMLRAEVLDGDDYPGITLASRKLSGARSSPVARVAITIRDATRELDVPVAVTVEGRRLDARGAFTLNQTDFGITPFAAAFGALAIQDELRIRFHLVGEAR
jgi:polyisoprenoid-binding protein YceI